MKKTLIIAIHRETGSPDKYAEGWAECLEARGIDVCWIDLTSQHALHQVQSCSGVMWHWRDSSRDLKIFRILNVIEGYLGIPVFPSYHSSWHRRDKLSQYYLFQTENVPMPRTWVFWSKEEAKDWAIQSDYPSVLKLSAGGFGTDVVLVSSCKEACRLIDHLFGRGIYNTQLDLRLTGGMPRNWAQLRALASRCKAATSYVGCGQPPIKRNLEQGYAYFQEFVPGNDYTTRIIVIGDRAVGFLSLNEPNDFRAHSIKFDFDPTKINPKCVRMAFDISERFGFHFMGYDFLLHNGEPVVLEMNFGSRMGWGYWNHNLEWINNPISPEEAQVELFLSMIHSRNAKSTMPLFG